MSMSICGYKKLFVSVLFTVFFVYIYYKINIRIHLCNLVNNFMKMIGFWHVNDVIFNYYFAVGGLFLSYLIYRLIHSLLCETNYMFTKYNPYGHTWRSIQCNTSIPYNIFCNACRKLMLPVVGLFCECCGVSACKGCRRLLEKQNKCKVITWPNEKAFHHLWVTVGVSQSESVDRSNEDLRQVFCSWCQRTKSFCDEINDDNEECDFEKYRNVIIPPTSVVMEKGVVARIIPLKDPNWEPLIILANRKSGSNRSDEVLSIFRGILNPIQVVDIGSVSPESVSQWLPSRCRVLVAGGDGTVSWVLNALAQCTIRASVAILPMGTGNDLSRVLGWGATCSFPLNAHSIIRTVTKAVEQPLDRWRITIRPKRSRLRRTNTERTIYAYNYVSIGVDAQIALDFHRARTQFLYRYASRTINYMAYLFLGVTRTLDDGGCHGLERRLRVRVDNDVPLPLPPLQALVMLNIPSWCAGVDLWKMGDDDIVDEQELCDGKFEVVGISSSFHIARLQCGLAEPYRFLQASQIKIELSGKSAMQVDGEPWMQGPAMIMVQQAGCVLMLKCISTEI